MHMINRIVMDFVDCNYLNIKMKLKCCSSYVPVKVRPHPK